MTSPVNNFQDVLDAMERDPALRDALRRHILTDELLQVPVQLEKFITEQRSFNEDMKEHTSNTLTRLDRMEGDSGTLKGYWARNTAVSDAAGIAHDMGLEFVRTLNASDLMELKTVPRPPIYPNGTQIISPVAPSSPFRCPHAVHRCPSVDSGLGIATNRDEWTYDF